MANITNSRLYLTNLHANLHINLINTLIQEHEHWLVVGCLLDFDIFDFTSTLLITN
ncbi:hypothetical protein Hanom_Chr06g00510231 [Helianthus anomalus]